jgi:metal-responsive CopG/Arc/MetJ family transcriptional regulator
MMDKISKETSMRHNDLDSIKTTVTLPKWQVAELDRSVEGGVARSRSELIAIAVGELLREARRRKTLELMKEGYEKTSERDLQLYRELEGSHPGVPEY